MSQYDELKRLAEHHRSLGHAYTVATPAAVLSLIAENERLHKLISWQGDANIEVTISAGQLMKHMDERDQLKAENAGLRTGYQAYERVNAELKAEVEALKGQIGRLDKLDTLQIIAEQARQIETLRKELESRHPFKFAQEPTIGFTGCVICGVYTDHGGLPCPKIRATAVADAALGKGEQS